MARDDKPKKEPTIRELREAQEEAMMRAMFSPPPPLPPPLPPPTMPDGLTDAQAKVWDRVIPLLKHVSIRDADSIADLCRWMARMEEIAESLKGMSVRDKDYESMLRKASNATANYQRYAEKYGLCPKK